MKAFTVMKQIRERVADDLWVVIQWNDFRDPQIIGQWANEFEAKDAACAAHWAAERDSL
jgi:hypothetical protein